MHSSVVELPSTIVELYRRISNIMALKFYTDGTSLPGLSLRRCRTAIDDAIDQAVIHNIDINHLLIMLLKGAICLLVTNVVALVNERFFKMH